MSNYQYIVNPQTNRSVSIHTRLGKQIIKNYSGLQNGGGLDKIYTGLVNLRNRDKDNQPTFEIPSDMGNLFISKMSLEYNLKKTIHIKYRLGDNILNGTIKQSMLFKKLEFKDEEGYKAAINALDIKTNLVNFFT